MSELNQVLAFIAQIIGGTWFDCLIWVEKFELPDAIIEHTARTWLDRVLPHRAAQILQIPLL